MDDPNMAGAPGAHKEVATNDVAKAPEKLWRAAPGANGSAETAEQPVSLLSEDESSRMRKDWEKIQASFVDSPREAVREADRLVEATTERLVESFSTQRAKLDRQWSSGGEASTEDLRLAFRRYRSFFDRLLSI